MLGVLVSGFFSTVNVRKEFFSLPVPPSVSVSETERTVKKGDPTTLRCDVTGDIPLTITWAKANRNLPLVNEDR